MKKSGFFQIIPAVVLTVCSLLSVSCDSIGTLFSEGSVGNVVECSDDNGIVYKVDYSTGTLTVSTEKENQIYDGQVPDNLKNSIVKVLEIQGFEGIGRDLLNNLQHVENVKLSGSITKIDEYAFSTYYGSLDLTEVTLTNDNVDFLDHYIPDGVISFVKTDEEGRRILTFKGRGEITSDGFFNEYVSISSSLTTEDGETGTFSATINTSVSFWKCDFDAIEIGEGITSIPDYAFYFNCEVKSGSIFNHESYGKITVSPYDIPIGRKIDYIHLPSTLVSIGTYAFYGTCPEEILDIPVSVQSIGYRAFELYFDGSEIHLPWTQEEDLNRIQTSVFGKNTKVLFSDGVERENSYSSAVSYSGFYICFKGVDNYYFDGGSKPYSSTLKKEITAEWDFNSPEYVQSGLWQNYHNVATVTGGTLPASNGPYTLEKTFYASGKNSSVTFTFNKGIIVNEICPGKVTQYLNADNEVVYDKGYIDTDKDFTLWTYGPFSVEVVLASSDLVKDHKENCKIKIDNETVSFVPSLSSTGTVIVYDYDGTDYVTLGITSEQTRKILSIKFTSKIYNYFEGYSERVEFSDFNYSNNSYWIKGIEEYLGFEIDEYSLKEISIDHYPGTPANSLVKAASEYPEIRNLSYNTGGIAGDFNLHFKRKVESGYEFYIVKGRINDDGNVFFDIKNPVLSGTVVSGGNSSVYDGLYYYQTDLNSKTLKIYKDPDSFEDRPVIFRFNNSFFGEDVAWEDAEILEIADNATIGTDNAFGSMQNLKQVILSVSNLPASTFGYCQNLSNVVFSSDSNLKEIGERAFESTGIISISIPSGVSIIRNNVFFGCSSLEKIYIPATVEFIERNIVSDLYDVSNIKVYLDWNADDTVIRNIDENAFKNGYGFPMDVMYKDGTKYFTD